MNTKAKTKKKLTHARHDPAHCLMPGLFRSFKKGGRDKLPLNVSYDYGDEHIEVKGPELLGTLDLRILQGLIALAGPNGLVLDIDSPKGEKAAQLVLSLDPQWDALLDDALVVKDSYYRLAQEIGYKDPSSGSAARAVRECIERLWFTSMIVQDKHNKRRGHRILGTYESDINTGIHVALNPRLARAISGGHHTRLELAETRQLKTDAAVLIHQRLCGFIDQGECRLVDMPTLVDYVWHDSGADIGLSAVRMREGRVRKGLEELRTIGWTVTETAKRKFTICRPGQRTGHQTAATS